MKVRYRVLPGGQAPEKSGAAYDLFARLDEPVLVFRPTLVPLGIALDLPEGYGAIVKSRSSGPLKRGFEAHVGLIDPEFNGREVCALIEPVVGVDTPLTVRPGERVAQLWIQKMDIALEETSEEIALGHKQGFGSTGEAGRSARGDEDA
jgi:dUTPase